MLLDDSTQEIVPGLTRAYQLAGRAVVWTFAPPLLAPEVQSLPNTYYQNTLLPLAKAWKTAAQEVLLNWPSEQPYWAVHACPTLGDLIGPTALSKLARINLRSIWLEPKPAPAGPGPTQSRLAIILDPQLSAQFNWRETSLTPGHVYSLFLAADAAQYAAVLPEALAWLASGE